MAYRTEIVADHPLLGQKVKFAAQPYHRGTMIIGMVERVVETPSYYTSVGKLAITGTSDDATTTSRIGAHSSTKVTGGTFTLYHYTQEQVERCIADDQPLIYVYPV